MKKSINVVLIALVATFTTTLSFAQSPASFRTGNQFLASDKRSVSTLPLSDIKKKGAVVELSGKAVVKANAEKKAALNNLQFSSFLTNTSATSYTQTKKLTDGTSSITVKEAASSVGKVAVKEAKIVYDNSGIVSIDMNMDKQKGKAFIDANLAKYGHPNNESVLDNFSWIIGGYVLEVLENNNNYTAIYTKANPTTQFINEGVTLAVR